MKSRSQAKPSGTVCELRPAEKGYNVARNCYEILSRVGMSDIFCEDSDVLSASNDNVFSDEFLARRGLEPQKAPPNHLLGVKNVNQVRSINPAEVDKRKARTA